MRNESASGGMISAIFHEWLEERGFSNDEAYKFSIDIMGKIAELEEQGYLVYLRQEGACHHCGKRWPRDDNDFHIALCSKCRKIHDEADPQPKWEWEAVDEDNK